MTIHRFTPPARRARGILTAMALTTAVTAGARAETLAGHVVDQQDRPVAGAAIELTCESLEAPVRSTSDDAGAFRFDKAEGACTLTVEAEGFARYRSTVTGAADLTVILELPTIKSEIMVTSSLPELATERRLAGGEISESGVEDLAEVFRGIEGMSAVRRGPLNLEPTIRGLQEEQVGMFVDGTRTFSAGPGRMDSSISHVGTHATQNVRVIKGPYALSWGAGTLSALQVETLRPEFNRGDFTWHGAAGLTYGDNASNADGHLGVWGSGERFRFYLSGGRRQGDDYEDGDGIVVPADYESTETRWRFGFRPSESLLFEYSGGYQEQNDIDYPGRLLDATYFYARSHALELTWSGDGTVAEIYGQLYANRKDHLMNNDEKPTAQPAPGRIPPFGIEVALPTESNTEGGRFKVTLDAAERNVEWSFGADFYRVEQTASRTISRRSNGFVLFTDVVWPDAEIEDLGAWGQAVWSGDGVSVGATLRFDDVDSNASGLSPFFQAYTTGSPQPAAW